MLQHPEWQRQQYITLFNKVKGILEFAASVGVKSSDVVDSEKGPPPEPTPPSGTAGSGGVGGGPPPSPVPNTAQGEGNKQDTPSGVLADRLALARSKGHKLVQRPGVVFCKRCACYAKVLWQNLTRKACKPADPRTTQG